jgi:hypothetical protein
MDPPQLTVYESWDAGYEALALETGFSVTDGCWRSCRCRGPTDRADGPRPEKAKGREARAIVGASTTTASAA